jgi:hypothetical protein
MSWHPVPLHLSLLSTGVSHLAGTVHRLDLKVRLSMAWHYVTVHLSLSYMGETHPAGTSSRYKGKTKYRLASCAITFISGI